MGNYSYSYTRHFSGAQVSGLNNRTYQNRWNCNGTWHDILTNVVNIITDFSNNSNGAMTWSCEQANYSAINNLITPYSGSITFDVRFFNSQGNVLDHFVYDPIVSFNNESMVGPSTSEIQSEAQLASSIYNSNDCAYFKIYSINITNLKFVFKNGSKYLFIRTGSGTTMTDYTRLESTAYTNFINLTTETYTKSLNISMSVQTQSVTCTTGTNITTTIRNRNESNTGNKTLSSGTIVTWSINPNFIQPLIELAVNDGYFCHPSQRSYVLNHQDYMNSNITPTHIYNNIIRPYGTKNGNFNGSSVTECTKELIIGITGATTLTACTYTFTWTAAGYDFYRNYSSNSYQDNVSINNTFTTNYNSNTIVNVYSKNTPVQTCHETIKLLLYDEDEGQCSYLLTSEEYPYERYLTPPTDVIEVHGVLFSSERGFNTIHKATNGSYGFSTRGAYDPSTQTFSEDGGFYYVYGGQKYYPSYGGHSWVAEKFRAHNDCPSIAEIEFTSHGEALPIDPSGVIFHSVENHVVSNGVDYGCSVRYHLTGNRSFVRGTKVKTGTDTYKRTSLYYVGVKKNTIDFINGITEAEGNWSDTIGNVTYTYPIAYANKVSTGYDLIDKVTCFHGKILPYWDLGNTSLRLTKVKSDYVESLVWNSEVYFQGPHQVYNDYNNIKRGSVIRYITFTYNGITYEKYENTWPIRWKSYPTFTSYSETTFTYRSGLCVKSPVNNTIFIFTGITESEWSNLVNTRTDISKGTLNAYRVNYNGKNVETVSVQNINLKCDLTLTEEYSEYGAQFKTVSNGIHDTKTSENCDFSHIVDSLFYHIKEFGVNYGLTNNSQQRWIGNLDYDYDSHIAPQATNDILYTEYFDGITGITKNYVVFTALDDNSTLGLQSKSSVHTLEYSINNGSTWNTMTTSTNLTVNYGGKVYVRGVLSGNQTTSDYTRFKMTGNFKAGRSINYLWDYTNPDSALKNYCGYGLFSGCTALTETSELELPATTLAVSCYYRMFRGCTSLTTAPVLPATTLAGSCYRYMFQGCTSLTTAPELPATTLNNGCYQYMFYGCTSLTTAPALPATTLASNCYYGMFYNCSSLTTAPELPATTLTNYCYQSMFSNCTSLTTAPSLPATTLAQYCYSQMFNECTSLTTAPAVLPATTLANYCYEEMFRDCPNLTTAPELPATTLTEGCYDFMFVGCTSLNYIKCLATDISADSCTGSWVSGVASTGTFVKNSDMTSWTIGVNGIPTNWVVENYDIIDSTLKFTAKQNSSTLGLQTKSSVHTLEYSTDGGSTWTDMTTSTNITLSNVGDYVYVRGVLSGNQTTSNYTQFTMSGDIKVSGNINYLWNKDNPDSALKNYCGYGLFSGCTALTETSELELPATTLAVSCYYRMFRGCTSLTTAPILPATTLAYYCYCNMFRGCTSLTTAPELPAITLAQYCYGYMFYNCTSLTTAPVLPATTLANYCYYEMFDGCTSLTTAPVLPATTLANQCYRYMFYNCTSLTTAPAVLPATTLADYCYEYMFYNCTSLTTAPELPATTLSSNCYSHMFRGCTSLTTAPELPATTLANYCYQWMFMGCTSLTTAPELPATTLADDCYGYMFQNCTSLTTAPELPATTLANGCYRHIFYNCTSLNYIKCLATDISATDCTYEWVYNVASTGTFVKNSDMTSWTIGINGIPVNWTVENEFAVKPVKFTAKQDSSTLGLQRKSSVHTIEYSTDGGNTWSNMTTSTTLTVNSGNSVYVRGVLSGNNSTSNYTRFKMTGNFKVGGNINTLWDKNNPDSALKEYCGYELFVGCTALTEVSELVLPATTLAAHCYRAMFNGCTRLTTVPALPATTLASYCYYSMFEGCTSLITGPTLLPATTLTNNCYQYMFSNCTSLTKTPALPATTLAVACYSSMFAECTSLTTVSALHATTLSNGCYASMFSYCTSLTTAPALPATTLAVACYSSMFEGCTSLTTAPELPATTLADYCYQSMFNSCTSLVTMPELPALILKDSCYEDMFYGCSSLTTAPELPANTLAENCYYEMFAGCTSLITIPEILPARTLEYACYEYMFQNCTSLTTAPELPANTLVGECYYCMFEGCSNLNYIKCLAINISAEECTSDWVSDVASTGTFVKNETMTSWTTGNNGIPNGWETQNTFESLIITSRQNNSKLGLQRKSSVHTIEYSTDDGETWSNMTNMTYLTVNSGNSVYVRGVLSSNQTTSNFTQFKMIGNFKAGGNINALWNKDNPDSALKNYCGYGLFSGCTLTDASELELPATTLAAHCYEYMFRSCSLLTTAPVLPATTLASYCYYYMFQNCTSLTTAPVLPATTLTLNCYQGMFQSCTSLTTAPVLPATTLANYCYYQMFYGCTSLATVPAVLPATTLTIQCYEFMFQNCTSLTTAPVLPATTLAQYCYYYMFSGCISLTTAPVLPATTLANNCYSNMFSGCTSLTTAPALPATTLTNSCYANMFYGCTSLTTAPELPATTLDQYCYSNMFQGCSLLITAPALPATTLTQSCYSYMFYGCTSLTTAPVLPATTLASHCYYYMFQNCTSLTTAPVLPATTLTDYCYQGMFQNCTSLTTAPVLPATTLANSCYSYMFSGCTSLTTAPELPATTLAKYCYSNMFQGCSSLKNVQYILPATTLTTSCYYGMFYGCSLLKTAPILPAQTTAQSCYSLMFYECSHLTSIVCLLTERVNEADLELWTYDVGYKDGCILYVDPNSQVWDECGDYTYDCYNVTLDSYYNSPNIALQFISKQNGSTLGLQTKSSVHTIEYSTDGETWSNMTTSTNLTVNSGYTVYVRGILSGNQTTSNYTQFKMSGNFKTKGCIDRLWSNNFNNALKNYCGYGLFSGCTALSDASELLFSATTLSSNCYSHMFRGCTSLTIAPILPANTLATYCYQYMFWGCTSLTTAPVLPATTLASGCYYAMFHGCTSLTTAPVLPATTLANYCYQYMFSGCTSLNYITCFATDISATDCTTNWVYNVASTGTFIKNRMMNSWTTGVNGVPTNWIVDMYNDRSTALKFRSNTTDTTITLDSRSSVHIILEYSINNSDSWHDMSMGTSINLTQGDILYVRGILDHDQNGSDYTHFVIKGEVTLEGYINSLWDYQILNAPQKAFCGYKLFEGVSSISDVSNLIFPNTTLADYCYSYMFKGTDIRVTPVLPATTLAENCYSYMFESSNLREAAPELPATTLANYCYDGMFSGCDSLETAPVLPAPVLSKGCYQYMFNGCSSLYTITCLATDIKASDCTYDWVHGVSGWGTFYIHKDMYDWQYCDTNGIPCDWDVQIYGQEGEE